MASHQLETAFLILSLVVACLTGFALYAFMAVCQMSLDLQEWVVVRGTSIVMRVKFGKCHRK